MLRYDLKHPYYHTYNEIKNLSGNQFIPIFSQCTSDNYADIPFINVDDIRYSFKDFLKFYNDMIDKKMHYNKTANINSSQNQFLSNHK